MLSIAAQSWIETKRASPIGKEVGFVHYREPLYSKESGWLPLSLYQLLCLFFMEHADYFCLLPSVPVPNIYLNQILKV